MKKIEIFGLWLCLLGIFLLIFGGFGSWAFGIYGGLLVFLIGSFLLLNSLWDRRKEK